MSRGRFMSRGSSFRGGRGSEGWGSSGRGSFSSRGRSGWMRESSGSFQSRDRYDASHGSTSADRYSTRVPRTDDSMYHRYGRMATSSQRSHGGNYGGGSADYSTRYNYSEERRSYQDNRVRGFRDERRSSAFKDRSKDEYSHRKAEPLEASMHPPSSTPRHISSPRASFRGRASSRGSRGGYSRILARKAEFIVRKRTALESYRIRKRILAASSRAETLRRLRIQRIRRLREKTAAAAARRSTSKIEGKESKDTEDVSMDEKEENWDDVEETEKTEKEQEEGEVKDGNTEDKEEKSKIKKSTKITKTENVGEENEADIDDPLKAESEKDGASPKKSENKADLSTNVKEDTADDTKIIFHGRPFIHLSCPQCSLHSVTFKEYVIHLRGARHSNAMRRLSLRHKQTLARMRMRQRQTQRVVEETEMIHGTLSNRSNFCPICKLNYRQPKIEHQASESHRAMKRFLLPYCSVCQIGFKSPMQYENHISGLDHIKRKARLRNHLRSEKDKVVDDLNDDKDINMDNFMTLDSVGTVDDAGDEEDSAEGTAKNEKKEGEDLKPKQEAVLGADHIKSVEVYFCELCRTYLPRLDQKERAIAIHCRSRTHLQRFVRYRDDRALRKKAERIHKEAKEREVKEAEAKKTNANEKTDKGVAEAEIYDTKDESKEVSNVKGDIKGTEQEGMEGGEDGDPILGPDLDEGIDDKLWADVDKDLGELLREVEPETKSSDEDEDSHGDRYDRFRYSEKGNNAIIPENESPIKALTNNNKKESDVKAESEVESKKMLVKEEVATPSK